MAEYVFSRLHTNQTYGSNLDGDLSAYKVANDHDKPDEHGMKAQKLLTVQQFIVTQQKDVYCWHLVRPDDNSNCFFLNDDFGILLGRARLDGAMKNLQCHL